MRYSRFCGILLIICIGQGIGSSLLGQEITVSFLENGVQFTEGRDSILFYQTAPKDRNGSYSRSNYIHPLYALDGSVITEDFPEDHLHHRGIFWAWHQLYVGDARIGDGWEIKDFSWEVKEVKAIDSREGGRGIRAGVHWKSPFWLDRHGQEIPLVEEITQIMAYPANGNYRLIDISISLLAMHSNMRLGGSEDEKGYGGFSYRIRLPEDLQFSGNNGLVSPEVTPVQAGRWLNLSGSLGKNGNFAGLVVLPNPKNPGFPNPWILRAAASMQNAVYPYPGATPVPLSEENPTVLRYRIIVHEGLNVQEIEKLHQAYLNE